MPKIEIHNGNRKGQIKKLIYAYVDFEDWEWVSKFHWFLDRYPRTHLPPENSISDAIMYGRTVSMGNLIMNAKKGEEVTYRDGDCFNCRRENLLLRKMSERPGRKKMVKQE